MDRQKRLASITMIIGFPIAIGLGFLLSKGIQGIINHSGDKTAIAIGGGRTTTTTKGTVKPPGIIDDPSGEGTTTSTNGTVEPPGIIDDPSGEGTTTTTKGTVETPGKIDDPSGEGTMPGKEKDKKKDEKLKGSKEANPIKNQVSVSEVQSMLNRGRLDTKNERILPNVKIVFHGEIQEGEGAKDFSTIKTNRDIGMWKSTTVKNLEYDSQGRVSVIHIDVVHEGD